MDKCLRGCNDARSANLHKKIKQKKATTLRRGGSACRLSTGEVFTPH